MSLCASFNDDFVSNKRNHFSDAVEFLDLGIKPLNANAKPLDANARGTRSRRPAPLIYEPVYIIVSQAKEITFQVLYFQTHWHFAGFAATPVKISR